MTPEQISEVKDVIMIFSASSLFFCPNLIAARGAPPAPNSCVIAMIIVMIGKAIDNPPKAAELSGR